MYVSHSSIRDLFLHINLIIDRGSRRHVVRCRTRNRVTLNTGVLYFLSIMVQYSPSRHVKPTPCHFHFLTPFRALFTPLHSPHYVRIISFHLYPFLSFPLSFIWFDLHCPVLYTSSRCDFRAFIP